VVESSEEEQEESEEAVEDEIDQIQESSSSDIDLVDDSSASKTIEKRKRGDSDVQVSFPILLVFSDLANASLPL
jgi:hypothetical protein